MKQNVKIFLIALVIGMTVSLLLCLKLEPTIISNALETKVTYFYVGSYKSIEEAKSKEKNYANALIYNENGIYRVIIGVYSKEESIDLMDSFFLDKNINFQKKEVKASNELVKKMREYELLISTTDKKYYDNLNNSLLKVFNEYINGK